MALTPDPTLYTITNPMEAMMKHKHRSKKMALGGAAVAIAALLLSGCATTDPASNPTPTGDESKAPAQLVPFTVAFGFLQNYEYAGSYIADDSGLYAKAGLDMKFLGGGPNAPAPEVSITSGEAVVSYESNTSRLFSYLAKADDIVIIGQQSQEAPNGLLSLAKHPVRTADELKGARIIAGAQNKASIGALMTINGVKDYTFVPGGADVGPLLAGQGDAMLAFATNQPITLEQQGLKEGTDFFFTPFSELNYHLISDVVIVSKAYLESNRDDVVNYMAATIQGWEEQLKDPAKGAKLAVEKYGADLGLNLEQQTAAAKAAIPYMTSELTKSKGLFAIDPAAIEKNVYPGLTLAGITNLPDVNKVIDTTVLEDAYKKLGK